MTRTPNLMVVLHGDAQAQGVPVVLSHALGLDLHMWDGLVAALVARGHPVLCYDHRGHGASASPAGAYAMDDLVDDAARLVRRWNRGPVAWVGLSMGGMVGQGLAIRHPELVSGLVIANSTSRYPEAAQAMWQGRIDTVLSQGLVAIADGVMERYFAPGFRAAQPDTVAAFRACVVGTDPVGYVGCCHAVAGVDWLDQLHRIACPTLVIAGAQDMGAPVAMSEQMVERIEGAQLQVFEGAAHLSVVEQPAQFRDALLAFLAGAAGSAH